MNRQRLLTGMVLSVAFISGMFAECLPIGQSNVLAWQSPDSPIQTLYAEVEKLYVTGKYDAAIVVGERLLALKEKSQPEGDSETGKILLRLASLYRATSNFDQSETAYKKAIAIAEKSLGESHPTVGAALERYSCLLRRRFRNADADALQKQALRILAPLPSGFKPGPVTGTVVPGTRTRMPEPSFPSQAKKLEIGGTVSVQVLIDETGKPITACSQDGPEILTVIAEDSAFQARWTPTTLDRIPVRVNGVVIYRFVR